MSAGGGGAGGGGLDTQARPTTTAVCSSARLVYRRQKKCCKVRSAPAGTGGLSSVLLLPPVTDQPNAGIGGSPPSRAPVLAGFNCWWQRTIPVPGRLMVSSQYASFVGWRMGNSKVCARAELMQRRRRGPCSASCILRPFVAFTGGGHTQADVAAAQGH